MKKLLIFCAFLCAVSGCAPYSAVIDTAEVRINFRDGRQSPVMYTPNKFEIYRDSVVRVNAFGDRFVYTKATVTRRRTVEIKDKVGTTIYK